MRDEPTSKAIESGVDTMSDGESNRYQAQTLVFSHHLVAERTEATARKQRVQPIDDGSETLVFAETLVFKTLDHVPSRRESRQHVVDRTLYRFGKESIPRLIRSGVDIQSDRK